MSMVNYRGRGLMLELRRDESLQVPLGREVTKPSSEDLAKILEEATRMSFTIDERLLSSQPDYGFWKLGKIWSVMLHMAEKQPLPCRWERTSDGYHLTVVPGVMPWLISGMALGIGLAVFGLFVRGKKRAERGA